jgi:hypothetical protein
VFSSRIFAQHLILAVLTLSSGLSYAQETSTDEVPAPQKSLLKTAANADYNKPLYFDQIDNGLVLPPLELEYDLQTSGGKALQIGNSQINEQTFFFSLGVLAKSHPQIAPVLNTGEGQRAVLLMRWPEKLFSTGQIEMISRTGRVLWSTSFAEGDQKKWNKQVETWRLQINAHGIPTSQISNTGLLAASWAITDLDSAGLQIKKITEPFRFCLTQTEGRGQTRLCSRFYGLRKVGDTLGFGNLRSDVDKPRVLVQNEEAPLKASAAVDVAHPVIFFAEMLNGESYEFMALPNKLQLMDIADTKNPKVLRIVGYETRPLQKTSLLNPDQYNYFISLLGLEPTIGDSRKFWAAAVWKDDAKIYLPGQGGGVFKQRLELSEIPRAMARPYLNRRTPTGTYIDGVVLKGRKSKNVNVASDQNSVQLSKDDDSLFEWKFGAKERGEINRSYLNVNVDGKTYRSYYEIYKGYPRELSGRFSGVAGSGQFIVMGEVAYNQWFEDLLGWTNYWVARQRWGISAKYFQSFNQLKVDTAGNTAALKVLNVDLKFRLQPGLWNRDETFGVMASYQNVDFGNFRAPMMGVGGFWARSMPKSLDELLNYIPTFNHPKWVDVELIYYGQSLNSNVTLNTNVSLNFHGKVLWTNTFFGEAGFGLKRYAFTDSSLNQSAALNTVYGTVGVGLSF